MQTSRPLSAYKDLVSIFENRSIYNNIDIAVFKWACTNPGFKTDGPDPFKTSQVRVLVVTWNLAGNCPSPLDIDNLLHPNDIHHDIFVVGT